MTITDTAFSPFDFGVEEAVELIYPSRLSRPLSPPYVIYLDLNHWIGLADAAVGRSQGDAHREALDACRAARESGLAVFPLSATHYMEISKILSATRRSNLASLIEELSEFCTLLSRTVVMRLEIGTVIDNELGHPTGSPDFDLLGFGVGHALGVDGAFRIVDGNDADTTDVARLKFGAAYVDQLLAAAELLYERAVLRGPRDAAEEAALRDRGWLPDAAVKVAQERADREKEFQAILDADPRWRKGRLRDVVLARELNHEMWDAFVGNLAARGVTDLGMMHDRERARAFIRSMPSAEVITEFKTVKHRNSSTKWNTNTIFDIDAMALAVPYCDVVVTERNACSIARDAGFGERMGTALFCRPEELVDWLADHRRLP